MKALGDTKEVINQTFYYDILLRNWNKFIQETINGLTDTSDYNQVKQDMTTFVTDKTKSSVLYCKFYRKENKYLGCGDFTIDTMEGMNTLLLKENNLKDYSLGKLSGTFYRYNANKTQ